MTDPMAEEAAKLGMVGGHPGRLDLTPGLRGEQVLAADNFAARQAAFRAEYSEPVDDGRSAFVRSNDDGEWFRVQFLAQLKGGMLIRAEDGALGLVRPVTLEELT